MKRLPVLLLVLCAAIHAFAAPQFTLKVGVDLVNILFTVTDKNGRLVPDLTTADFAVEEDGRKQEILHFTSDNNLPLTIAMLLDISPSVRRVFGDEQRTASAFFRSILQPRDLALIISFDRSVTLFQDFTESPRQLASAINELELGGGGTSLYDAVYLAAEEKLQSETGRKAIIVISDGQDTTSRVDFNDALIAAHQSDTVIYSIVVAGQRGFGIGGDSGSLREFSEETGGGSYALRRGADFDQIFGQISRELRSQYSLAYRSSNTATDGKYRRLRIIPRNSSLNIRARRGYYAAKDVSNR